MGWIQERQPFCHRVTHATMFLLLLSLCCLIHQVRHVAEGRAISKLQQRGTGDDEDRIGKKVMRSLIGSRPPRCERRCSSCGHCEAVQVPFVPQVRGPRRSSSNNNHAAAATTAYYYTRGDDISNYKPMTWKCKCGDMFLNP